LKRINIQISDQIHETLKEIGEEYGVAMSQLCTLAIGQYVQQMRAQKQALYGAEGLLAKIRESVMNEVKQQRNQEEER
jgi:hypothetical protein